MSETMNAGTLVDASIDTIRAALPSNLQSPRVGIICGSGLSNVITMFHKVVSIPYAKIPGFSRSTVPGHESTLAFGLLGGEDGVPVVAMLGRFHPYEGHALHLVVFPVRVMAKLGVKDIIITNASGSLNPDIPVGTIVVIQDHVALPNLTGMNPLFGPQISPNLPRFLPLSDAYSPSLRRLAFLAAHHLKLPESALAEGVYAWVSGPSYETAAEGRFLRKIGADVVGMSTVPEVLAGREEGLNVMVLSLVTNFVVIPEAYRSIREEVRAELAGESVELQVEHVVSHEEVLTVGKEKAVVMMNLIQRIIAWKLGDFQNTGKRVMAYYVSMASLAPVHHRDLDQIMTSIAQLAVTTVPSLTMQDELGIVYLIDTAQQFWSELEDILYLPEDEAPTLSLLDATLRRFLVLCSTYHEQYLQSPLQLEHACNMLLNSELFVFHSERMCEIIVDDALTTTDPHSVYIFYQVLFFYGRRRSDIFRSHKRWQPLLPLLMDHVNVEMDPDIEDTYVGTSVGRGNNFTAVPIPIEAKLRSLSVRLLFEVCRVQNLSIQDLKIFDDHFIDYLFDLVEQTRYMHDDTFNYSVIKLVIVLNEQFMVTGLGGEESQTGSEKKKKQNPEPKNRIIRVMMRRLENCRTFGENMIFMLNRAKRTNDDFCLKLLILKILYLIFSTNGMSEYFYTNDLCVLMDVFLRELADLDEGKDNESLRHTYLRVLHPLLTKTQLRDIPYKRPQILVTLESLLGNSKIREVDPTTKRLVDRCLSGDWCVQLRELREKDGTGMQRVGSPNSETSTILSPPSDRAASMQPDAVPGNKVTKSLKHSKSVEQLSARAESSTRQILRSPLDQVQTRRTSNGSIQSLPTFVSPSSPKVITAQASKRRSTSATLVDDVQTPRHNSLPHAAEYYYQHSSPHTQPAPPAAAAITPLTIQAEELSTQVQPRRRPPPPAPTKRRKPPAIPLGRTHGGATITTIKSSEPSPLSKVHKAAIGLQQGTVS